MRRSGSLWSLVIMLLWLTGCNPSSSDPAAENADAATPDGAAIRFFTHLYNDDSLDGVLANATPKLGKLIKSYHTNRNVQRHVVNLVYDEVVMEIDPGRSVGMNKYADKSQLTVFFTGTIHGKKKQDLRLVRLVKAKRRWLVAEIEEVF